MRKIDRLESLCEWFARLYAAGVGEALCRSISGVLKHREVIDRVTFWGVNDGDSWLNNWPVKGRTSYPLLFDRAGQPKPVFAAVIKTSEIEEGGFKFEVRLWYWLRSRGARCL